jgi:Ca2+-transporting ATPase
LIALTVVLAVGMQKILKKKGLVKDLLSAETLGGVTTICVDKTGTLTYGKLKVVEEYGDLEEVCIQHFASSDDPIMVAAKRWLEKHAVHFNEIGEKFLKDCTMVDSIPFTPQNRFYASFIRHGDHKEELYVNGAPEHLLEWSTLPGNKQKEIREIIRKKTLEGMRVIGMAKKTLPEDRKKISEVDVKGGLTWVGLLIFTDPVRKTVGDAFVKTKEAGIKTILITGDYADTAKMVMKELGMDISDDRIFLGQDLEKMTDAEVSKKLQELYKKNRSPILFARKKPEQKLKVISALKLNNEVVAMMGDGVNDAPALHKADIGVVVGEAVDVARESAIWCFLIPVFDNSFNN